MKSSAPDPTNQLSELKTHDGSNRLWYRCCHWLCAHVYFERITVVYPERVLGGDPAQLTQSGGPTLYVVLHRNGAVDGFVYHQVVPRGVYLISTQLLRGFFGRLFFSGIPVARKKDQEDGSQNEESLRRCVRVLADGGELIVFPEGTSSLGPSHLPFKSGAARLALDALAQGVALRIVPLGVHYERAWAFRSKVEVVVGEDIPTDLSDELSGLGRLKEMKRRMTRGLEDVGCNFATAAAQEEAECLAYGATLGSTRSYFGALKALEAGVPEVIAMAWSGLHNHLGSRWVLRHQGVPLFPVGPWLGYAAMLAVIGPLVIAGTLLNLPPLLAAWLAARRFADAPNVIALWRTLVGVPLTAIWAVGMAATIPYCAGWFWSLGYLLLTLVAIKSLYRTKKLAVAVWNGLANRRLMIQAHVFHHLVQQKLPPQ
ncbi:MAG: 1-acyl-sn-glycerol-3-phosphate acyltransferase [Verrucomicrobiota bacterium]